MNLTELGWNIFFQEHFEKLNDPTLIAGRVAIEEKGRYLVLTERGELGAEISGKIRFMAGSRSDFPAVGDWVAIDFRADDNHGTIKAILPRKSAFVRKEAGVTTEEQVVAVNVDTVFLISGLDHDFNIRRIERYLALSWESGANPVIILNKADICPDIESKIAEIGNIAIGVPVHPVSAKEKIGFDAILPYLNSGVTVAFLGSSGVGKSTLINSLLGEDRIAVQEVRDYDSRGRHTTTHREMIVLPSGAILIDTPGMRVLKLWGGDEGLERTFDDITALSRECRFRDCSHELEPGCAVQEAINAGRLDKGRYASFLKLKKELRYLEAKQIMKASAVEKLRWRQIAMYQKKFMKNNGRPK
jgi:ribosome biogenesis GTPase